MEPLFHSVSAVRLMSVPALAEMALRADELVGEYANPTNSDELDDLEDARTDRRIALDELVRRGAIESYSFV